jgi:hypothetical protein
MLEEVRRIKEEGGVKVPLSKDDWIEKLPSTVKSMFFEEELKELEIPDIEQLAQLSPEEVEELLDSVSEATKTESIDPQESYSEIVDALKVKFDEIEEEEVDEASQKKRLIRSLPSCVCEQFSEEWLENLTLEELKELNELSEEELQLVMDTLSRATENAKSEQVDDVSETPSVEEVETEEIDFEEELERLELKEEDQESTVEEVVEDVEEEVEEQVVEEEKDEPTLEESALDDIDVKEDEEPQEDD